MPVRRIQAPDLRRILHFNLSKSKEFAMRTRLPITAFISLLCLTSGLLVSGCGKKPDSTSQSGAAKAAPEEPPRPVRSVVVGNTEVGDTIYLPGDIRARHEQRLGFRVGGKIASRAVEVGQTVAVGKVLATLDSADVMPQINAQSAQLEVARVNTKFQEADLKRQQELRDKGFISAAAIDRQATSTDSARAQEQAAASSLANARNALAFQTLRADRAGIVVGIDAEAGNVVAAGQSVIRLAQTGEIEVAVNVPERSVNALRSAKSLEIAIEALPGKLFKGTLRELAPSADPATRTFPARLSIAAPDEAIKLGMTATVRATIGSAQAITIPLSAIATRDGQQKVWIVDNATQTVQATAITTGAIVGDAITVASGLGAGQRVVTAGANLLIPGQKVRVVELNSQIPAAQISPKTDPNSSAKPITNNAATGSAK
jgi:membrane fusion protein, multidrug efflux system